MKKAKHVNKLIFLIVLVTVAFLSMGASSWLIISENSANPAWTEPGEAPTLSGLNAVTMYEGDTISTTGFTATNSANETVPGTFSITTQPTYTGTAATCETKATVKFTPEDTSTYKTVTGTVNVTLRAVAYIGSTYYATIDKAITSAVSGNNVIVCESYANYRTAKGVTATTTSVNSYLALPALTIRQNQEIKSGVTITIPCGLDSSNNPVVLDTTTDPNGSRVFGNDSPTTKLNYNISIAPNITVTNNGTIQTGGAIGGGSGGASLASITFGRYGQITLNSNSTLINNKTIDCYGFIDDIGTNAKIINQVSGSNAGVITTPFTIYEQRGGTAFVSLSGLSLLEIGGSVLTGNRLDTKLTACPFNRFWLANIMPALEINYGTQLIGYCNLYMGGASESYVNLAGSTSDFVFSLESGSKFIYDYNKTTQVGVWDIYGSASLNPLKMPIDVDVKDIVTGKVRVVTDDIYFPISWHYNFNLHPGASGTSTMTLNQDIKLMPGATFIIDEGVTVNADNMAVYDDSFLTSEYNQDATTNFRYTNPTDIENVKLVVNGVLNVNNFGGNVTTLSENSKFKTNGTSVSTYEVNDSAYTSAYVLNATGDLYNSSSTSIVAGTQYYGIQTAQDLYEWYCSDTSFTLAYDLGAGASDVTANNNPTTFVLSALTSGSLTFAEPALADTSLFEFVGWYLDSAFTKSVTTLNGSNITNYLNKETATITLYAKYGQSYLIEFVSNQTTITITDTAKVGGGEIYNPYENENVNNKITAWDNDLTKSQYFDGWYLDEACESQKVESTVTINAATTLYAKWLDKVTITINKSNATVTLANSYTANSYWGKPNQSIKYSITFDHDNNRKYNISGAKSGGTNGDTSASGTVNGNLTVGNSAITITASSQRSCIAAGTMVTLADGTQKKVEDIVESDLLLVFNHETGEYVPANILFLERGEWAEYNVINLEFSNGQTTKLIYEHALFDLTLNKYVYITESNYANFIGHTFALASEDQQGYEVVTLNKAYIAVEYTAPYSITTVYHYNFFIDDLFSIPGAIDGLFNIFEYGEGLKYDEEKMQADIEKYGLYGYEYFADYMTYEMYESWFPAQYYSVAVGKGHITYEEIIALFAKYADDFVT